MERLEQFARGDLDAFESLFREYQGEVFGWIVRIVRDRAAAEDLTLETFWRLYRAHARFDPRREFGPWARRIATHTAIDYLKRARPEVELTDGLASTAAETPDPRLREAVRRAFFELPAKLRAVATLSIVEEAPQREVAEALGISLGTVKSRTFRAIRLLRQKLQRQGIEP
jgi:RNA polymerase sigma factor (sigma-70 family)